MKRHYDTPEQFDKQTFLYFVHFFKFLTDLYINFTLFFKWTSIRMRKPSEPNSITLYGGSLNTTDRRERNTGKLKLFSMLTKDFHVRQRQRIKPDNFSNCFLFSFKRAVQSQQPPIINFVGETQHIPFVFQVCHCALVNVFYAVHKALWNSDAGYGYFFSWH